jgi:ribonucleoside-diphosphate reductase alpha chain
MRNATLLATAPNANIGLIAATTPGMDPRFAQVFSRNKISGKYLDINHNLVKDLKNLGLWEKVKDQIVELQGDISSVVEIPDHIRDIYKTSFSTSPHAFIEVAARAQKWMDQGISRNMYLDTRDIEETMKIYMSAWEKGVKTTYYLHMKPRHTAEQSTVSVNKSTAMGRVGFGALKKPVAEVKAIDESELMADSAPVTMTVEDEPLQTPIQAALDISALANMTEPVKVTKTSKPNVVFAGGKTCPTDPAELAQCDSCQ